MTMPCTNCLPNATRCRPKREPNPCPTPLHAKKNYAKFLASSLFSSLRIRTTRPIPIATQGYVHN